MPRSPRNSVQSRLVNAFMEVLTEQSLDTISTTEICRRSGVHRTSFYRYFEGIADLEAQFLNLYFQGSFVEKTSRPASYEALVDQYALLIQTLEDRRRFFAAAMREPRLLQYSDRLKSLLEAWLRVQLADRNDFVDPDLWELNLQFALGTIFRLCELIFLTETELSVRDMARWMLKFLGGGRSSMVQAANGSEGPPWEPRSGRPAAGSLVAADRP